jgi:DNA-binding XRE family transcriptional regulator
MQDRILANYLRTYRRRSGLSQREVGILVGYQERGQTSRHEQFKTLPPLAVAIAYEVLFRAPVSTLFLGTRDTVQATIEKRLAVMERDLQSRSANDADAESIARKLEWIVERREH